MGNFFATLVIFVLSMILYGENENPGSFFSMTRGVSSALIAMKSDLCGYLEINPDASQDEIKKFLEKKGWL